jgi:undecaprenyl phosphate N,N'-diacetylbacillosamine 1-phosphate transferase
MYRRYFKRFLDIVFASLGICLLSPLFILLLCALAIGQRGKVFFVQTRPGKDHCLFKLIKFKTMNEGKDALGALLPDEERLTFIGSFIRKTSLDELPELLNIIKGEMSLVGPRPLLQEYLPLYNKEQQRRHEIRPGLTGWAQVNGRNAISWEQKFDYDLWYIEHLSFWLDLKIIFLTFLKALKAEGISAEGAVTMPKFAGSNRIIG